MVKTILYTSNPNFVPNSLEQVENFASDNDKYYTCMVSENSPLSSVKEGAHIVTSKGNHVYVLEVGGDYEDAKKCSITGVVNIDYPFGGEPESSLTAGGLVERMKSMFLPTEAKDIRIAQDGNLCIRKGAGFVSIDANNQLVSYPEELTLEFPVFLVCKPKEQLVAGDVVALDKSYVKVTKVEGNKIKGVSYSGGEKTVHLIKDFLFNQTMVRVATSAVGSIGGQINPLMLMCMSKGDSSSLLPLMMMNQSGGALNMNPMMLMLLSDKKGKGDSGMKDMLLMSAMMGGNAFGNMFNQPVAQPVVPQPVVAPQPAAPVNNED